MKVRVGWVNGQNHLYFLYEASDNYWDFAREDLHNDIFEVVIDGDLSGGPLIRQMHPNQKLRDRLDTHFLFHGVHAQNYNIFTPAEGKDWAMVWGSQPWIKDLPFANAATRYNFRHSESGKLVLEFFVTPFDHAPPDRSRAVQTKLEEDKVIGMSWAVLDYDDETAEKYGAFWNLSHKTTLYGDASDLVAFRLMPIEKSLRKPVEADWSFQVVSQEDRVVAFRDCSYGNITLWHWDFGDGGTSQDTSPVHLFPAPGTYNVCLIVSNQYAADTVCKAVTVGLSAGAEPEKANPEHFARVFPNPADDFFQMVYHLPDGPGQFRLFDATGRLLRSRALENGAGNVIFNIGMLPSGLYWYTLQGRNCTYSGRLVKQ